MVSTAPMNVAPSAPPNDPVPPSICDPTHSQSNGVPIHSTRLPIVMIMITRTAPTPVLNSSRIWRLSLRSGPRPASAAPG